MTVLRISLTVLLTTGLGWSLGCEQKASPPSEAPAAESGEGTPQETHTPAPAESAVVEPPPADTAPSAPAPAPAAERGSEPVRPEDAAPEVSEPSVEPPVDAEPTEQETEGVLEERWPDGKLKEQRQVRLVPDGDPVPHGEYRSWYENSQIKALGQYVDGKKDGEWSYWHADGELMSKGTFGNGLPQGVWQYWIDDGSRKELEFVDGIQNGRRTAWYANGQMRETVNMVQDKPHGLYQSWNTDGSLAESSMFEHGRPVTPASAEGTTSDSEE